MVFYFHTNRNSLFDLQLVEKSIKKRMFFYMYQNQKKFLPKKKLLQYHLEEFLYWRFEIGQNASRTSKGGETARAKRGGTVHASLAERGGGAHVKSMNTGLPLSLSVSQTFHMKNGGKNTKKSLNFSHFKPFPFFKKSKFGEMSSKELFFPEKKPFMQFWTLPLLGASVLTFLTFEKQEWQKTRTMPTLVENKVGENFKNLKSEKTKNLPSFLRFKNGTKMNQEFDYYSSNLTSVNNRKEKNETFQKKTDIQNLCLFYFNLTKEKLDPNLSKDWTNENKAGENLFLKSLYLKNSQFHWTYYPLYSPDAFSEVLPSLKAGVLKEDFQLFQKLNPNIALENNGEKTERVKNEWKKNPTLSYLKSVDFFATWFKNSKYKHLENGTKNDGNTKISNFEPSNLVNSFENSEKPFKFLTSQSLALQSFEKLLNQLNQSKTSSLRAYMDLKKSSVNVNFQKIKNPKERKFQKMFFENFENKYKTSALQLSLKKNFSESFRKQKFAPSVYNVKEMAFQKEKWAPFRLKFKKSLLKTLFTQNLKEKESPFFLYKKLKASNNSDFYNLENRVIYKQDNLERNVKDFLSDLFLLQDLKVNLPKNLNSKEQLAKKNPYTRDFLNVEKNMTTFETNVWQKDSGKFLQEIQLYSQFHKIQKTFIENFNKMHNLKKPESFDLDMKNKIYFSNKENLKKNQIGSENPGENSLEIYTKLTSLSNQKGISGDGGRSTHEMKRKFKEAFSNWNPVLSFLQKVQKTNTEYSSLNTEFYSLNSGNIEKNHKVAQEFKQNMRIFNQSQKQFISTQAHFKKKTNKFVQVGFLKPNFRKTEKSFRTYLSIKNAKNLQTKKAEDFFLRTVGENGKNVSFKNHKNHVYSILKKLKKNVLFSKTVSLPLNASTSKKLFLEKKTPFSSYDSKQSLEGSLFEKKLYLRKLEDFSFLKHAHLLENVNAYTFESEFKIFEKKKSLEKKRRLKKLKLENRRRKKRKRFYPRPQALRFQLYLNFLQKRHKVYKQKFPQPSETGLLSQKQTFSQVSGILKASPQRARRSSHSQIVNYTDFQRQIYGKSQNIPENSNNFFSQTAKTAMQLEIPHQKEFYKISNQTLTEFERLCWKSYWLRSNLKPYVSKIQKSLKRMKDFENLKTEISIFSGLSHSNKTSQKAAGLNTTPVYVNIRKNLNTYNGPYSKMPMFQQFVNKAEYERLLYDRINDEIKNVKSQLTVEGQSQARSYKAGRQKLEKNVSKPFWNGPYAFVNNYLEPNLNMVTSFQNSPFIRTDFTNKSFPTLRLLWACQKSQLFTYQQNNLAHNLWTSYKIREQTKNNQTRKFFYRLSRKMRDFQDYLEVSQLQKSKKEQSLAENPVLNKNSAKVGEDLFENKYKNRKLQNLSVFKTNWANKKMQTFGGFVPGKTYASYLKSLKFQLQQNPISKKQWLSQQKALTETVEKTSSGFSKDSKIWFETNMENPIQKRQFHFWWSLQKPETSFPFFLGSPVLFSNSENLFLYPSNSFVSNSGWQKEFLLHTFWLCASVLHVAIFFALVRIPEIRSLVKFQVLIFSKLCNAYLIGVFALYDLLKNYQTQIQTLTKKLFRQTKFRLQNFENASLFLDSREQDYDRYKFTNKKQQAFEKAVLPISYKLKPSNSWIQSTMHWNFHYKTFSGLTSASENLSPAVAKAFPLLQITSISPLYGKSESLKFNSKTNIFLNSVQSYESWATGFFWKTLLKNFNVEKFSTQKKTFTKEFYNLKTVSKKRSSSRKPQAELNVSKKENNLQKNVKFSYMLQSNIQIQSILSLAVLASTRFCFSAFYVCLNVFYKFVFQMIDLLEGTLLIFYKFLEKPAEVVVDWIAEVFLIEWTSDIPTYVPEAFDTGAWTSVTKFSRSTRFFYGLPFGFVMQRFFLESTQLFYQWLLKPDTDLMVRQKKGIIFWDIWSEILIQAAEKYKMNLSSLSTIKEEQELLIENLLEQQPMETQISESVQKQNFFRMQRKNNFLNQEFSTSLKKLDPLIQFIESKPSFEIDSAEKSFYPNVKNQMFTGKLGEYLPVLNGIDWKSLKPENLAQNENFKQNSLKRWSVTQYINTQGKDTDLFMDIHPPKDFSHVSFLKTYLPAQEILGSLVCEIYAGLFASKVSKNVLIVGAPGMAKSFFIQALAGETELKIVLDNAHRYAFVNGGVPVGMKLLREVFDSIALHTPCLFLLEDVHVIGERRPMLISDDETSKTKEFAFGAEQEEVHEKNKLVYQLSKHALSHYKKPYKGDFSLAIPTNHFCYDLFLGVSPPRKRRADLSAPSPLPIQQLESALNFAGVSNAEANNSHDVSGSGEGSGQKGEQMRSGLAGPQTLVSALQISAGQVFAPPATSPFHVLLMKEQKKLKPKKLVKDVPWSGLSYDQWMLLSKSNYSVRVKVALLAETAMKNLSVKLDMITDLLVIIDSVRSNRGFVVFATTHLPALLDPALRRPGRLDETISLPLLPNIQTRFEIFKTRLTSYTETMDFFDWSLYSGQTKQNENLLSTFLNKNILLLLNSKYQTTNSTRIHESSPFLFPGFFKDYPIYSLSQAFQSSLSLQSLWNNPNSLKKLRALSPKQDLKSFLTNQGVNSENKEKGSLNLKQKSEKFLSFGKNKNNYISLSYAQAGQFLTESLLLKEQSTYSMKFLGNLGLKEFSGVDNQKFMFQSLYGSSFETKQTLFKLLASKISEFFVFQAFSPALISTNLKSQTLNFEKSKEAVSFARLSTNPARYTQSGLSSFNNLQNSVNYWQAATSFLDAMFQKRYLYNKNSIVFKMLFFEDNVILGEAPSPPSSSILMPARKFENYKKTMRDFIQKPGLNINQKLEMHQKQRFLKLLYNIPVQNSFVSPSRFGQEIEKTSFYSSFKELGYLDLVTSRPSATYAFYKNRFFQRQRFSFLNQWWNGQLAEHNAETTYLSHIDWRSMFVPELGDVFIDFPDAEQYYNPRHRRWFLQSKAWSYWFNFETDMRQQISEHFLVECFTKTSILLHSNREMFDYLAYRFLRNHSLHELDLLQVLVRFHKKKEIDSCFSISDVF